MQIEVRSSFERDTKKLSDKIREDIADAVALMSSAKTISDIPGVKDIKGGKKAKNAFRMRIGEYRICFYLINGHIELIRVLPRKDVYKIFP
jgi:mRNA interferase RelE/StbE